MRWYKLLPCLLDFPGYVDQDYDLQYTQMIFSRRVLGNIRKLNEI